MPDITHECVCLTRRCGGDRQRWHVHYQLTTVTDRDRGRRRGEGRRPYLHLPLQHLFSRNNEGEREERLMTNPPHSVQCPSVFRGFISFASHTPLDRNEYNNKGKETFHLFLIKNNFLASHLHGDQTLLCWGNLAAPLWRPLGSLPRLSSLECSFCLVRISHGLRLWASLVPSPLRPARVRGLRDLWRRRILRVWRSGERPTGDRRSRVILDDN